MRMWEERVAIIVADAHMPPAEAKRLAWEWLQAPGAAPRASC